MKKAIKETTNLIVTYKNKPINSFYHGSNGGISAMASESWKINDYPYLQTKIDAIKFPETFIKIPIKDQSDLSNFLDFEKDQFYGDYHPFFRWKKKISNKTIENILIKKKNISTSENIYDLKVRERGLSGRVTKLEIQLLNSNKNFVLFKDDIRRIFSFLPSNLFTIDKLNDNLWFFKGGGFGHGVGLSQSGAIEMAKLGFTYEQILNHYYRGTKLKSIETSSQ